MAFEDGSEKELQKASIKISKTFPLSGTSLASLESLSMPLVQQVVLSADMQCEKCQKRVADIITKMDETESIEVNMLEKKVTLTFRISSNVGKVIIPQQEPTPIIRIPFTKVAIIKRIFRSSRG